MIVEELVLGRTARAIVGYTSAYPDALVVRVGATLKVDQRTPEFPGWLWCRDSSGMGAWVPEAFLELSGDVAVLTADYSSTELTVLPGATVEVVDEVAGWVWCRDGGGQLGWLPAETLGLPS